MCLRITAPLPCDGPYRSTPHYLPLRDLIDGVDAVHPFHAIQIALLHRIDLQISRLANWIRLTMLANLYLSGSSFGVTQSALAVAPLLAQVVRYATEIPASRSYSFLPYSPYRAPECTWWLGRSAFRALHRPPPATRHRIAYSVAQSGTAVNLLSSLRHFAALQITADQLRHLRPAQSGHDRYDLKKPKSLPSSPWGQLLHIAP